MTPNATRFLLARLPYNKDLSLITLSLLSPVRAAKHGYVVVLQDTRGGSNLMVTLRRLPTNPGWRGYHRMVCGAAMVKRTGRDVWASYYGATQWLAATANPPALKAMVPTITSSGYHEGWTYQGGAFQQGFIQFWTAGLAVKPWGVWLTHPAMPGANCMAQSLALMKRTKICR